MTRIPDQRPDGEAGEDLALSVSEVLSGPSHDGGTGEGLVFRTSRGDLRAILHRAPEPQWGVVWACGARGGFGGPGQGLYARLAEAFRQQGVTSLRLDYRYPNLLPECVMDLLVGVSFFQREARHAHPERSPRASPEQSRGVVLVGHSFGGAVVIAAGVASPHVKGVVSLSPQTYGAHMAGELSPRPLLVVHGKSDTRLPYYCAEQIYTWAREPKHLVLYEGAEHRLEECREELEELLKVWIPATLAAPLSG